ncbi:hypothetical protein HPB49_010824 [Dermacentor silvarum]|uniref:Uncharacterized protein n=1 Tax=Dermacentor silvarum TaxID=543639 RepID=A0ACB8CKC2_DERSI|nr:hypothetical protein HPB49_010824 [Dermacentor silvarum]
MCPSDAGNRFVCDCRLAWMQRLQKASRSDSLRRELRHVKCRFKEPSASPNGSSLRSGTAVTALSLKELGCPEEHVLPPWQSGKMLDRHGNAAKAVPTTSESLVAVNDADGRQRYGERQFPVRYRRIEVNAVEWAITHQRAAPGNREKNCAAASCCFMYEAWLPLLLYFSTTLAQAVR